MDTPQLITLLTMGLPLIGAGVGYPINRNSKRRKNSETNLIFKEEKYQSFVNLIIDIFANTKLKKNTSDQNLKQLYEF